VTIKISVQEHHLPGADLVEKWHNAQRYGFDGLELLGFGDGKFAARAAELEAARNAGVVISSTCVAMDHFIGDTDPGKRADAVEQMKLLLTGTAAAGGVGVVTPGAYALGSTALPPWQKPRSDEETFEILVAGLTELGRHGEQVGACVLLEPLNRYEDFQVNTVADALALIEAVGLPNVGVMPDTFHMGIEETDIPAALRAAGSRILHVQVADNTRLEPGTGSYDWPATLAVLDEIGYDGWLAMECGLSGAAEDVLPKVPALLRAR
jgi:sugar phosphate isomerase/epimerase